MLMEENNKIEDTLKPSFLSGPYDTTTTIRTVDTFIQL